MPLRCPLAHRRGIAIPGPFGSANRAASSKPARFFRRWRRFAAFLFRANPLRWVLRGSLGRVFRQTPLSFGTPCVSGHPSCRSVAPLHTVAALRFPVPSGPPIAPLPRNRLAFSAAGGASPLSSSAQIHLPTRGMRHPYGGRAAGGCPIAGFCADPWDTLWGRVFRFPQTAGWGPSDSLHCSISPRRIVLHFCDICCGEFYRSDSFLGSGYASPWVSTRMDLITTGVFGLSFQRLVGTWEMRTASSTPSVT